MRELLEKVDNKLDESLVLAVAIALSVAIFSLAVYWGLVL